MRLMLARNVINLGVAIASAQISTQPLGETYVSSGDFCSVARDNRDGPQVVINLVVGQVSEWPSIGRSVYGFERHVRSRLGTNG